MNAVRKLSIVDCPMPETAIKPIVYGAAPWSRLPHTPPAHEINVRYRAQSLLSRGGHRAELPDYETAKRVIAAANKPRRVTVPEPINTGAGVSKAARLHVGVQRPFSGQTLEAEPREHGNTAPTVRGLSGESPEHPAIPQREPVRAPSFPAPAGVTGAGIHSHTLAGVPAKELK
jgi:hypothetical protein